MKTNKILAFFTIIAMSVALVSCVQDDEFSIPESLGDEENAGLADLLNRATEVSIADVKAMYNSDPNNDGNNNDAIPFEVENDIYVKGYVSSSDQTGNFFKEFFIQDSPSDPTGALKVVIEQVDSYNQFNFGREVYINLKGLFIGEERTGNGIFTIGGGTEFDQYGGTVTRVNQNQIRLNLFRSEITEEITPLTVLFSEINDDHVGMYVQVDNVEFADDLNGKRYFDPVQVFDTQRTMQVCNGFTYSELALETSSFSTFKEYLLPTGNGTIKAVVNKTFDGSTHVLALNAVEDVNMGNTRCSLAETIFEERFDSAVDGTNLDLPGWLNVSESGSRVWREEVYQGNGYAELNPFGSGDASNIAWLVTPSINMDAYDGETLTFQTAHAYPDAGHDPLAVYISTDFDGVAANIGAATWTPLDFNASYEIDSDSWNSFKDSGNIDLSSYTGTAYIAFVYTGSDTNNENMTLRVENVALFGE
jgi:hypothetical protein